MNKRASGSGFMSQVLKRRVVNDEADDTDGETSKPEKKVGKRFVLSSDSSMEESRSAAVGEDKAVDVDDVENELLNLEYDIDGERGDEHVASGGENTSDQMEVDGEVLDGQTLNNLYTEK